MMSARIRGRRSTTELPVPTTAGRQPKASSTKVPFPISLNRSMFIPTPRAAPLRGARFYNPPAQQFPAQYLGKYFFQDFCNGWVRVLDPANNSVTPFATFPSGTTFPTDMRVSPDGSLYILSRASGGGNVEPSLGGLLQDSVPAVCAAGDHAAARSTNW